MDSLSFLQAPPPKHSSIVNCDEETIQCLLDDLPAYALERVSLLRRHTNTYNAWQRHKTMLFHFEISKSYSSLCQIQHPRTEYYFGNYLFAKDMDIIVTFREPESLSTVKLHIMVIPARIFRKNCKTSRVYKRCKGNVSYFFNNKKLMKQVYDAEKIYKNENFRYVFVKLQINPFVELLIKNNEQYQHQQKQVKRETTGSFNIGKLHLSNVKYLTFNNFMEVKKFRENITDFEKMTKANFSMNCVDVDVTLEKIAMIFEEKKEEEEEKEEEYVLQNLRELTSMLDISRKKRRALKTKNAKKIIDSIKVFSMKLTGQKPMNEDDEKSMSSEDLEENEENSDEVKVIRTKSFAKRKKIIIAEEFDNERKKKDRTAHENLEWKIKNEQKILKKFKDKVNMIDSCLNKIKGKVCVEIRGLSEILCISEIKSLHNIKYLVLTLKFTQELHRLLSSILLSIKTLEGLKLQGSSSTSIPLICGNHSDLETRNLKDIKTLNLKEFCLINFDLCKEDILTIQDVGTVWMLEKVEIGQIRLTDRTHQYFDHSSYLFSFDTGVLKQLTLVNFEIQNKYAKSTLSALVQILSNNPLKSLTILGLKYLENALLDSTLKRITSNELFSIICSKLQKVAARLEFLKVTKVRNEFTFRIIYHLLLQYNKTIKYAFVDLDQPFGKIKIRRGACKKIKEWIIRYPKIKRATTGDTILPMYEETIQHITSAGPRTYKTSFVRPSVNA